MRSFDTNLVMVINVGSEVADGKRNMAYDRINTEYSYWPPHRSTNGSRSFWPFYGENL